MKMPKWLHECQREDLTAEIALLNDQYGKLQAAYNRLFADLGQSERNVEDLRIMVDRQREEIGILSPRRTEAEISHQKEAEERRQAFMNDTVVRGKRWGDMSTEEQAEHINRDRESSLNAAVIELQRKVAGLEKAHAPEAPVLA